MELVGLTHYCQVALNDGWEDYDSDFTLEMFGLPDMKKGLRKENRLRYSNMRGTARSFVWSPKGDDVSLPAQFFCKKVNSVALTQAKVCD